MSKKKKYLWGSAFTMFLLAYFLKPTIVIRQQPESSAGRSIASITEPKIDPNLVKATQHFCDKKYHKDSCLSFLAKCGVHCVDFLSDEARSKIRTEIDHLKAENQIQ